MKELVDYFEKTLRMMIREEIHFALENRGEPEKPALDLPKKLMNTKEAAEYCGVSDLTLYRSRKGCEIGFFRIGNRILFSVEKHLIPFLESRERKPLRMRSR